MGRDGRDLLYGGPGKDSVAGNLGRDKVHGGPGDDSLRGGVDNDVLLGGPDDDSLFGEPHDDSLHGGLGDDSLAGGPGADVLDGGPGTNRCLGVEGDDTAPPACDATAPRVLSVEILTPQVDTSAEDQWVRVRVRATDDLSGITDSGVSGSLGFPYSGQHASVGFHRVSGDALDGIYEGTGKLRRYAAQGTWELELVLFDRVGNWNSYWGDSLAALGGGNSIEQVGAGDAAAPEILSLSVDRTTIDTSTGAQEVSFSAHVTDVGTGIWGVSAGLNHDGTDQNRSVVLERISGDEFDGIYSGTVTVPRWSAQGNWEPFVGATDIAENTTIQHPTEVVTQTGEGDSTAPSITGLTITPRQVDTTASDQVVTVEATFTDDRSGVSAAGFILFGPSGIAIQGNWDTQTVSGDPFSYTLRQEVTLPQHSMLGEWTLMVTAGDLIGNIEYFEAHELAAQGLPATVQNGP